MSNEYKGFEPQIDQAEITKKHIKELIENYDVLIRKLIPGYDQIQSNVVNALNFEKDKPITVMDLGIGTGETAGRILQNFPSAHVIGVDMTPEMIEAAQKRLAPFPGKAEFITGNMYDVELPDSLDGIVSVLAIHHLTAEQKEEFYNHIYSKLNPGGILSVGDLVTFKDPEKAVETEEQWRQFLYTNLGVEQGQFRFDEYKKGDIPSPLEDQLEWIEAGGFEKPSVTWELMNYATFKARK